MNASSRSVALGLLLTAALLAASPTAGAKERRSRPAQGPIEIPGTLIIFSTTVGASVEVDGKVLGTLPLDEDGLAMMPGPHTVRVSLRGWTEYVDTFTVNSGEDVELEIDLIPIAGIVRIETNVPGASVSVNGKAVGATPFDQDVTAGKVTLAVKAPGYHEMLRDLDILAGQSYDLKLDLVPMEGGGPSAAGGITRTWWFWTTLGVVVASGATVAALALGGDPTPAPDADGTLFIP